MWPRLVQSVPFTIKQQNKCLRFYLFPIVIKKCLKLKSRSTNWRKTVHILKIIASHELREWTSLKVLLFMCFLELLSWLNLFCGQSINNCAKKNPPDRIYRAMSFWFVVICFLWLLWAFDFGTLNTLENERDKMQRRSSLSDFPTLFFVDLFQKRSSMKYLKICRFILFINETPSKEEECSSMFTRVRVIHVQLFIQASSDTDGQYLS